MFSCCTLTILQSTRQGQLWTWWSAIKKTVLGNLAHSKVPVQGMKISGILRSWIIWRISFFFNINLFNLIGGSFLYNIVLVLPYITDHGLCLTPSFLLKRKELLSYPVIELPPVLEILYHLSYQGSPVLENSKSKVMWLLELSPRSLTQDQTLWDVIPILPVNTLHSSSWCVSSPVAVSG